MKTIDSIILASSGLIFASMIWKFKAYLSSAGPDTKIYKSREEIKSIISEVINYSSNYTLWGIAGELSPFFYESIIDELVNLVNNKNGKIEFIAGPKILIKDELYNLYISENGKNKENYWKAHPLINLAYTQPDKVKIYLKKNNREKTHCFCSDNTDSPTITEREHRELESAPVLVERNSTAGYMELHDRFNEVINSKQADLWNPRSSCASEIIQYMSCSQMRDHNSNHEQI
ncbi:MAG: hypothetical protein A2509_03150 [Candidatus Edwardsbacteria bacterium RIFOXYD12_FULL_50_11]|uniref:Uncharacterized protein n=1 Tax=Candidatus Edwardsbacteria bacterium GWF2_54_11 TaxID=1817851 RepID=A0A1F5RI52_9BACT|nr:MAG: hypothetical protein A2502_07015 [Candidatus Edwardsbacteria bacterium RifOxyC12_full_54_24]OGF14022.1 MAG: hypothetical protein A2024_05670 [Candidatus Edwardsbacteria bacterium GWF2_54_11]OGF16025.1 MAG: hypothetical protein A2509_03150 [Candidatus Edwardsbacteria bacterium RIFOXYD12_FULL_50_11]OGJ17574.1 MAG: hypothetical protein A2349_04170 [Candidatus Edwardsbacteria bacterium RifOxyB12_full_52_30]OGT06074.1 MAG: hypothetical protein A2X78_04905 [Gammaproteobacteria bacterium GWE2_